MSIDVAAAKALVDGFVKTAAPTLAPGTSLLPANVTDGKAYEAVVLCDVLARLKALESYTPTLATGQTVTLRVQGGPIDPKYAHFDLTHPALPALRAYTDIEFTTMSYCRDRAPAPSRRSHRHELDVLVVDRDASGRPCPDRIRIAVECKATKFEKVQLRALLGVRRELGLLTASEPTGFAQWPRTTVPIAPPSCLMLYSTSSAVHEYRHAASTYGVDLVHLPA